jgi:hypothetical protein
MRLQKVRYAEVKRMQSEASQLCNPAAGAANEHAVCGATVVLRDDKSPETSTRGPSFGLAAQVNKEETSTCGRFQHAGFDWGAH